MLNMTVLVSWRFIKMTASGLQRSTFCGVRQAIPIPHTHSNSQTHFHSHSRVISAISNFDQKRLPATERWKTRRSTFGAKRTSAHRSHIYATMPLHFICTSSCSPHWNSSSDDRPSLSYIVGTIRASWLWLWCTGSLCTGARTSAGMTD